MTSQDTQKPRQETPSPQSLDSGDFKEVMRTVHDLGGETGGPIEINERIPEQWERNTFVTCECLAWRGVWNNVEKHRLHADLGQEKYLGLPYYGRWLLSAARAMLDKNHITVTELTEKMEEVKKRHGR